MFFRIIMPVMLLASSCISIAAEDLEQSTFLSDPFKTHLQNSSQFTVAVMPMENISLEAEVAYHFRQRVVEQLIAKGYTVLGNEWIDGALYELGLTHAGQLRLLSLEQLKEVVKADAFMFGIVEEARSQHAGVYNSYVYKSSLKLDSNMGENLWYSLEQRVSKRRFSADPINAVLDVLLVKKGGDAKEAVMALADRLLGTFPQGPVNVVIGDDLLSMAMEVEAVASTPIQEDVYITASESSSENVKVEDVISGAPVKMEDPSVEDQHLPASDEVVDELTGNDVAQIEQVQDEVTRDATSAKEIVAEISTETETSLSVEEKAANPLSADTETEIADLKQQIKDLRQKLTALESKLATLESDTTY